MTKEQKQPGKPVELDDAALNDAVGGAFDPSFLGGVRVGAQPQPTSAVRRGGVKVAVGDVNGDG